ncbi:uncharacterized protein LOC114732764 [Neltuma alba]|uniref:uncharacterized protein LOC114732764 n=1 Tax=Neltuma alba TaxID=207710 RepID=UPI0010A4AF65|nr:uncharacterized protein LOC114732764 [Prosopis alba]
MGLQALHCNRPWDPPLFRDGWVRALETGRTLRKTLGFPINRVFVSPFLRCVQTASEVVTALCAVRDDTSTLSSHAMPIDPSKVKVSVEYGLCEMMNSTGIRPGVAPKDGNFSMDISKCEALLPAGTVDDKAERLYQEVQSNSYLFFLSTISKATIAITEIFLTWPDNPALHEHTNAEDLSKSSIIGNLCLEEVSGSTKVQ